MPILTTDAPVKNHVIVYFEKGNEYVKDFASRMRNNDPVEVSLCWSRQFNIEEVTKADAIVIEQGCVKADTIEKAYRRVYGDSIEIHMMTPEGEWPTHDEVNDEAPVLTGKPELPEASELPDIPGSDHAKKQPVENVASVADGSLRGVEVEDDFRRANIDADREADDNSSA